MAEERTVTVLGAGVVGLCCAVWMQREGFKVTLIDREDPGKGTSFGNAGLIHVDGVVPVATPGILRRVPKMLLDPRGPLVVRWRYLHRVAPWLIRFVAAAQPASVERISVALASLLDQAVEDWSTLIDAAGAQDLWRTTGELHVFRSKAAWEASRPAHELRRRRGSPLEELTVEEMRQLEPALARDLHAGVFTPGASSVTNPYHVSLKLTELFLRSGGRLIRENVSAIETDAGGARLITGSGSVDASRLVVAAGAFSRPFAAAFGFKVPLETERGYHLWLREPGVEMRRPIIIGDYFFGVVPMTGGLRLAGMAELAGLDLPPYWDRADMLGDLAKSFLPDLQLHDPERWMGHRPALPDSLPVVGRAPGHSNVYFAFGHGHLGLTMAAVTGRLISELVAGRTPDIDLTPFRVNRF